MNKKFLYAIIIILGIACGYLLIDKMGNQTKVNKPLSGDPKFKKEKISKIAKSLEAKNNPLLKKIENQSGDGPTTSIKFYKMIHDFGTIKQDTKHSHTFYFTNTGSNPLIISSARGSCGCTVPKYPTQPVKPGEQGEINVVFSSGKKKGKQNKSVTLTANTEPQQTKIYIKADVEIPTSSNKE